MSKQSIKRHYWDACLFLDIVNRTPKRHDVVSALWDELVSNEPKVVAVTSTLTIAEVAFATSEKLGARLEPALLAAIDALWAPSSPIELVELYAGVAWEARSLIRTALADGHSLRPHDAVHFATARKRDATVFWTYDDRLLKFDQKFG